MSNRRLQMELKRQFFTLGRVSDATKPFKGLGMDFKGPLPSVPRNTNLLTTDGERSFSFEFACLNTSRANTIDYLFRLSLLGGMPSYTHTNRGVVRVCHVSSGWREVKVYSM